MAKLLLQSAEKALRGFMCDHPKPASGGVGYRGSFDNLILPEPLFLETQWDCGDCTARALEAWLAIRVLTGDHQTGRDIQLEQEKFLFSIIHPETGLVFVPELSQPDKNCYYYHMWDQGRTLRYFVRAFIKSETQPDQDKYRQYVHRMIKGLVQLASEAEHPHFGAILYYTQDSFLGRQQPDERIPPWVNRAGQLIEPLAMYLEATNDPAVEELLRKYIGGALSGYEKQRGPDAPVQLEFAEDGSFIGQVHSRTSTLLGIAKFSKILWRQGKHAEAIHHLKLCKKTYDWIYDSSRNVNAAGSYGWFPEKIDNHQSARTIAETCCTADMIELGAELASAAPLAGEFHDWSDIWDDVDRSVRNALLKTQIDLTPKLATRLSELGKWDNPESAIKKSQQLNGAWLACFYPSDFITIYEDSYPGKLCLLFGACCMYSGPRALLAAWNGQCQIHDKEVFINLPYAFDNSYVKVEADDLGRELIVTAKTNASIHVRIPLWARREPPQIETNEERQKITIESDNRSVRIKDPSPNGRVKITFKGKSYITKERIGGNNQGKWTDSSSADKKIEYTLHYTANTLTKILPHGQYLPFEDGL